MNPTISNQAKGEPFITTLFEKPEVDVLPFIVYFRSFPITIQLQFEKIIDVVLGI